MDPESFFNTANVCFVNENYKEAAYNYQMAIELDNEKSQYYSHRAAANYKLGELDEALVEVKKAIQLKSDHQPTNLRHGQILFAMQRYSEAREIFLQLTKKDRKDKKAAMWERKAAAEIGNAKLVIPKTPAASAEKEEVKAMDTAADVVSTPATTEAPAATDVVKKAVSEQKPAPGVKHSWYQNDTKVFVSIFVKNKTADDVTTTFEPKEFSVSVKLEQNDDYLLDLSLAKEIVPESCKTTIGKLKIEIELVKKEPGSWRTLEYVEVKDVLPSYPTSNPKKSNWNETDKLCEKQLEEDKPEGDEALNKLFREIYTNANEDTRRAMIKSFQTSSGTVLSTNWDEVGKADYEGKDRPTAPDGQQWAK